MKSKFKIDDIVEIGNSRCGFDIAKIIKIRKLAFGSLLGGTHSYDLRPITRNNYLKDTGSLVPYIYPDEGWIMRLFVNGITEFKKIYKRLHRKSK